MTFTTSVQTSPLFSATGVIIPSGRVGVTGAVLLVSEHEVWSERYRVYASAAAVLADGFGLYSDEYRWALAFFSTPGAPPTVVFGRRAITDLSWAAALAAVKAAIDAAPADTRPRVWHVLATSQVEADQRALAAACTPYGWLFHLVTPSAAVRNDALGSLEKLIRADNSLAVISYYDAAAESGAAVPTAVTTDGPWSLSDGQQMSVSQDGGTAEICTFNAAPAILTATPEPYALVSGNVLAFKIDGSTVYLATILATAATITSSLSETFALVNGQTAALLVDGVEVTWTVTAANYVNVALATAAEVVAEALGVPAVAAVVSAAALAGFVSFTTLSKGTSSTLEVGPSADAAWAAAFGFGQGVGAGNVAVEGIVTALELATLADNVSDGSPASVSGGRFVLSSLVVGTSGEIEIDAATSANMLAETGFVVGTTNGSGDAANAASVTPLELFTLINTDITVPDVLNEDPQLRINGTLGVGAVHALQIIGPLANAVGLAGTFPGAGVDRDYMEAQWVARRAGLAFDAAPPNNGNLTWCNVALGSTVYGVRSLSDSQVVHLNVSQGVNVPYLVTPSRGPETTDGRLNLRYSNDVTAFIDQWTALRWLPEWLTANLKAAMDILNDAGDQVDYTDAGIDAWIRDELQGLLDIAVASRVLAFKDLSDPTPAKPTGLLITPKANLSSEDLSQRLGRYTLRVQLSGALHGVIGTIQLGT